LTVELRRSTTVPVAQLAELFNRAYEGYVIPFRVDEQIVALMNDLYDIDREASRVAFDGDEAVGLGNLGVRGEEGWIGGVGVVASARRHRLGEALMQALHEEARRRGVRRVWLEVIDRNESAFRLYEKLGYDVVRELEVWSLEAGPAFDGAGEVPVDEARRRLATLRHRREPWQRADATLDHISDLQAVATEAGAAVYRTSNVTQLLQIGGGDAETLLRTLRSRGKVVVLNLPTDEAAGEAFHALGGTATVRQREMVLEL
jgi:ribosomal protein S18 acetylase RimI-like enzyme